jgi:hypothetical protein
MGAPNACQQRTGQRGQRNGDQGGSLNSLAHGDAELTFEAIEFVNIDTGTVAK